MGRPRRTSIGGIAYHALNRGNRRSQVFFKDGDYEAFLKALAEALAAVPMRLLGFCLMPNHWHLVLWPRGAGDLSRFVGWVTNTHVKRYREHYQDAVGGHLYQGRFRSFPVQEGLHLLRVLRYVEGNPLRAQLAQTADAWRWSSFRVREQGDRDGLLSEWPVLRPPDWRQIVEQMIPEPELAALRSSLHRCRPFGDEDWTNDTARRLGLDATLRSRGRPSRSDTSKR